MSMRSVVSFFALLLCCTSCGADSGNSDSDNPGDSNNPGPGGEAATDACEGTADCSPSSTCVAQSGAGGVCMPNCGINANDCSGTASCGQVATLSVNVCKTKKESTSSPTPDGEAEQGPEELYVPCKTDEECQQLDPQSACITDTSGHRGCASLCTSKSQCATPSVGGITTDFFTCLPDQTNMTRSACMFNPECDTDPLGCISGVPTGAPSNDPTDTDLSDLDGL